MQQEISVSRPLAKKRINPLMMQNSPERLRANLAALIDSKGVDPTNLAKKIGRGSDYLRDFLNGRKKSIGAAEVTALEREFALKPGALFKFEIGEEDTIQRVPLGQEFGPDPEFIEDRAAHAVEIRIQRGDLQPGEVPERNVVAGLGEGGLAPGVMVDGKVLDGVRAVWRLPVDYLHTELRAKEAEVDFIPVDGDSMIPTLLPGDRVMINRSQTAPSPDGLFAIFDGIGIAVKRLEVVKGSNPVRIRIKSDNPAHGTDEILADDLQVIGRVVCKVTRL